MEAMTPRERVLAALNLREPDRIPWIESYVGERITERLLGEKVSTPKEVRIAPELLRILNLDNLTYNFSPPRYVKVKEMEGQEFILEGLIKTEKDLEKVQLPDLDQEAFYEPARQFLKKYKGNYAAIAQIRFGPSNAYLSMGIETFSLMLYDNPQFVETLLNIYAEWSCKVVEYLNELGFDLMLVSDDLAFKSGPIFSPKIFKEFLLPRMRKVAEKIRLPWIYHSDGNLLPLLDDLLSLGMNGLANIEPGAMDIAWLKRNYGDRICLVGNIDLHYTLTQGTAEEVEREVRQRIVEVGQGGGYILASSNGITDYCRPENVIALSKAVIKYGKYPLIKR